VLNQYFIRIHIDRDRLDCHALTVHLCTSETQLFRYDCFECLDIP
jgi:hypothetical protein